MMTTARTKNQSTKKNNKTPQPWSMKARPTLTNRQAPRPSRLKNRLTKLKPQERITYAELRADLLSQFVQRSSIALANAETKELAKAVR